MISIQVLALNQLFKCSTGLMNSILLSTNIHFLNPVPKFKTCRPPIRKTTLFLYSLVFVKALCFYNLLCALVSQFLHCISTQTSHNNTLSRCLCSFVVTFTTSGKIHKYLYRSFWQLTKVNFLDKNFITVWSSLKNKETHEITVMKNSYKTNFPKVGGLGL